MANTNPSNISNSSPFSEVPFKFQETANTVYYHNIKVFIFGADVTPYINGQISITKCDRNGVNICSFSLSNHLKAFEITQENLKDSFRVGDPYSPEYRYSEEAKKNIYQRKKTSATNTQFNGIKVWGPGYLLNKNFRDEDEAASETVDRYPFTVGSLVFHKYDPIRVFVQNPFSSDQNSWICEFAGYLDSKPFSQNYVNGQSIVNITAQDIRVLMKSMRTQVNPSAQTGAQYNLTFGGRGKAVDSNTNAGFFNDTTGSQRGGINRQVSHVLGGFTWKQSIDYIFLGIDSASSSQVANSGGVCSLSYGEVLSYDPSKQPKETLQNWNNVVIFGSKKTFLSYAEMYAMGLATYYGGSGSPDNAKIHLLKPVAGLPVSNLIEYYIDAMPYGRVEWVSRYDLLVQVLKAVDYQCYVNGMGDVIIEFPMYDFLPEFYGSVYSSLYSFDKHLVNDTIDDESGDAVTKLTVEGGTALFTPYTNPADSPNNINKGYVASAKFCSIFSNVLASRVGAHEEVINFPGVSDVGRLAQLGMLEFTKRLASFNKFNFTSTYRPFLGLNRPMFHVPKQRYGISETVVTRWNIRGEVETDVSVNYTRRLENGKFKFITGGEAAPISYSTLYRGSYVRYQGVTATPEGAENKPVAPSTDASDSNRQN